jgi:hypothetical protein
MDFYVGEGPKFRETTKMSENIRMRDIVARRQRQEQAPAQDARAIRMMENSKRHIAEQNAVNSWLNPENVREHLTNYHDATPVEVQDVLDLLATATHFTKDDYETGSAAIVSLATIRGEI